MTFKRILCCLLVLAVMVTCLSGCGESKTQSYNRKAHIDSVETSVVASNDKLVLKWDDNAKCILLENKITGKVWSPIPYDKYLTGEVSSTLNIYVQEMQSYQREMFSSDDIIGKDKISCKKVDNGVEVTYYFDKVKISIPLTYTLREDSMLLTIDASKVVEGDNNYRLYYAAPATKLCSVLQSEQDAYMFVPFGSGGIVNTTAQPDGQKKVDAYNKNVAALSTTNAIDPAESGGMQVFGIKDKGDAILGIAEDCAGGVGLNISAGDLQSDYSNIYPVFYFVDFDDVKGRAANSGDVRQLSERTQAKMSVGFYPLSGEEANYNGMARRYRKYLEDNDYIREKSNNDEFTSPYSVTMVGGVKTTSSIVGIPVSTLKTTTTFNEAESIVSDLIDYIGVKPVIRLQGFGNSGINYGEIAGGYEFASKFGSDKKRILLEEYCKKNNIPIYTQFEMIKFSKSGSGFSYAFDAAKTATLHVAQTSGVNVPLRDANSNNTYRLLARAKLSKAVDKLISFAEKKDISGISVSSLGEISYSDYSDGSKYSTTNRMQEDTKEYIGRLLKTKRSVAGSASTYFAAGLVDTVFEAPLETSGMYQVEYDIPFYQMVFADVTPLYSAPINTDSNPQRKIMLAAASGTGLGFSVVSEFEKSYMENNVYDLYACVYEKNKDFIRDTVKDYNKVYKAVSGSKISSFEYIDNFVSKTTFENGTVVYANHSSKETESPVGRLKGYGFMMGSEG